MIIFSGHALMPSLPNPRMSYQQVPLTHGSALCALTVSHGTISKLKSQQVSNCWFELAPSEALSCVASDRCKAD